MLIFKKSDLIPVKIEDVTFYLSPLSMAEKAEIAKHMSTDSGVSVEDIGKSTHAAIKYSVKKVEGIKCLDGSDYELELENGSLTDDCVSDLMNTQVTNKLISVCYAFMAKIDDKIIDPNTGKEMEGIDILIDTNKKKQPKK